MSRRILPLVSLLTVVVLSTTGCRTTSSNTQYQTKAFVTPEMAARAYSIVKGLDYIPFSYTAQGCWARAYFMALELAAAEIPASNQYIFTEPNSTLITGSGTVWNHYHVASMLIVTEDPKSALLLPTYLTLNTSLPDIEHMTAEEKNQDPLILDPSLSDKPLRRWEWIKLMKADKNTAQVKLLAMPGTTYYPWASDKKNEWEQLQNRTILRSFAEMQKFSLDDIERARVDLINFINLEKISDEEKSLKKAKLSRRIKILTEQLRATEKLETKSSSTRTLCDRLFK